MLYCQFPGPVGIDLDLYRLFAHRSAVQHELDSFAGIVPTGTMQLLADQMNSLVQTPPGKTRHRVRCQPLDRPVERDEPHDRFDAGVFVMTTMTTTLFY
jgi:hypothetical protein